ncbi:MAG: fibrobacter succinogenes major paralogous domain-containing protein [bacterium]
MSKKSIFSIITLVTIVFLYGCNKKVETSSVKIGNQTWMKENLNVDHYRNGDSIPEVKNSDIWVILRTGAWCYYDNDPKNGEKYGKLYNWYAVNDPRGLAPEGWYIPTEAEFETLKMAVDSNNNNLKAKGQGIGSGIGTNTSGFSALLAGCRIAGTVWRGLNGRFETLGSGAYFWSLTKYGVGAVSLGLISDDSRVLLGGSSNENGFSVRCLKNLDK